MPQIPAFLPHPLRISPKMAGQIVVCAYGLTALCPKTRFLRMRSFGVLLLVLHIKIDLEGGCLTKRPFLGLLLYFSRVLKQILVVDSSFWALDPVKSRFVSGCGSLWG